MAALPTKPPSRASVIRREVTNASAGLNEIMAGAGEPLMRFAALYLAIATGLPALNVAPVYSFCQSVLIVVPEFILLGAMDIAGEALKCEEQKLWGRLLYLVCFALAVVMFMTFVSIFVSTFSADQIKYLNFTRCLIAVAFSVLLAKLHKMETAQQQHHVDQAAMVEQLQQQHQGAQERIAELEQEAQSSHQQAQTKMTQLEQAAQSAHQVAHSSQEELARQVAETQQLQARMADLEVKLTTLQSSPVDMIVDKKVQRSGNKSVNQDGNEDVNQLSEIVDISVYKKAQPSVNKPVNQLGNKSATTMETNTSTNSGRGEARQKALSLLKRHPELTAADLAKKAGITRQYASKLISEQQQKVVNE